MILHTVNKSPYANQCLVDCLTTAATGDTIILIEDGVYGATAGPLFDKSLPQLSELDIKLYVLRPDFEARGLHLGQSVLHFSLVDDHRFVELVLEADKVLSWY
ncbi:MAG: sulfurtransferase complex subunit TusB [Gammaproteobacteria bacterium]|nr:MAG: sulfurtransferase complex subunit TusB [Gammaproteobacteria bacterium]RLA42501.1 MAG: sulfurtransferase complex subunit TusB [Gammaproteobacteria bacterium]